MQYPNIERQAPGLVETLSKTLIVYTKKFQQLVKEGVTHLEVLRHQATNYDRIRQPQFLSAYANDLVYTYAEEYLQTFIKNITNEAIASKLLITKKEIELSYQVTVEDLYKKLGAMESDKILRDIELKEHRRLLKEHGDKIDTLIKSLNQAKEEKEIVNSLLAEVEIENSQLKLRIEELKATVSEQAIQICDLEEAVSSQQLELVEQKQTIATQQSEFSQLKDLFLTANNTLIDTTTKLDFAITKWQETSVKLDEAIAGWEETKLELAEAHLRIDSLEGRMDNIEAQMQAMHTDFNTFIEQVHNLKVGTVITPDFKVELTRQLGNNIALAYSTITNLRLADPIYEQRKNWYVLLKQLWKSCRHLHKFGFNVQDHLTVMQIMLKSNPC